jgi:hypothetical protein
MRARCCSTTEACIFSPLEKTSGATRHDAKNIALSYQLPLNFLAVPHFD